MANDEHVRLLKEGVTVWNAWCRDKKYPHLPADLRGADLSGSKLGHAELRKAHLDKAILRGADLRGAQLSHADLRGVDLEEADLRNAALSYALLIDAKVSRAKLDSADLRDTNMRGAHLLQTELSAANLRHADLNHADLSDANLTRAILNGTILYHTYLYGTKLHSANLSYACLNETVLLNVDLSNTIGLETCNHYGPSSVDHRTLQKSGPLPLGFLRGVGLPDAMIEYLPSLLNQAIQHYSCFISYASGDGEFAERVHSDLQNNGVRCWFAPHDMPVGGEILDQIDAAIRHRDKVLLILSEHSIRSKWVKDEVTMAFEEERGRGQTVLFPIRIDDAVMDANEAWAGKLRARNIGNFCEWKNGAEYRKSFEKVLRDLTVQ